MPLARLPKVVIRRLRTALIDRTPPDCYSCLRNRADIDAVKRNGAARIIGSRAPSKPRRPFPWANYDWGRVLLAKGDLDGAIAKFEAAHKKGPRSPIHWRCGAKR
ncbi:MAG: hypothetical protein WDM89_15150 [Rhizomicrobium sp.]